MPGRGPVRPPDQRSPGEAYEQSTNQVGSRTTQQQQIATTVPIQRKTLNFNNQARLATLPPRGYVSSRDEGKVVIYLPQLPEEIELPRENQYLQKGDNLIMPDGLFLYQSTNPLEIQLTFTLHATDDLAEEGAKTLLDIAARLHSLLLPASNDPLSRTGKAPSAVLAKGIASQENVENRLEQNTNTRLDAPNVQPDEEFSMPPACSLRLMQAGARGLGVNCVGFVKSAVVKFHGPYLQTANSDESFNLPSAATYSFTFVHNPSYTNSLNTMGKFINAFGPDVYSYFYNTAHLAATAQNKYVDVADIDSNRVAPR